MIYQLHISRPPSVNTLYGITRRGIKYITKKGKDWFTENLWEVKRQLPQVKALRECEVEIKLKAIQLDVDNSLKACFDLLTQSGVIEDDQYIMKLVITKEIVHHRIDEGLDIIISTHYDNYKSGKQSRRMVKSRT